MTSNEHNIIDYDEVLRVLPVQFRELWKDDPNVLVYLSDLGSLGLQRLSQEPERLSEEKIAVLEQTQDLAFHNYKTFIQAAECSHTIFKDFNVIESKLGDTLRKVPVFKEKCSDFGKEAQMINARWRQASSTLSKHPQLLEILEIPQLMSNCVREGLYDEALELSSYVKRLERKHTDIPLIKNIVQDVQVVSNTMLTHLLSKLRSNIQLPECLKVIGFLRRMDVFNESELRIKFLQARDSWFQKVVNGIPRSDAYDHVMKIIESSRVHLFDITTQYRAIFSDDDPLLMVRDDSKNNCAIFHSWITWKISWFLSVLEREITVNLVCKIDSLLTQCMYFGLSFSRVNIDFRPLLIPIFENVSMKKFNITLKQAIYNFEDAMKTYSFSSLPNTTFANLPEESLQPPIRLLDFHPLAQYCNELLGAFNELKLCCSYSMSSTVVTALTNSLKQLVKILISIHSKKNRNMTDSENDHFNQLCLLLCSDLVPHLNRCLSIVFPADEMCQVLGVTSMEFKRIEYLCTLPAKDILQPLLSILPSKDEDLGLVLTINAANRKDVDQASGPPMKEDLVPVCEESVKNVSQETEQIEENKTAEKPELVPHSVAEEAESDKVKHGQIAGELAQEEVIPAIQVSNNMIDLDELGVHNENENRETSQSELESQQIKALSKQEDFDSRVENTGESDIEHNLESNIMALSPNEITDDHSDATVALS